MFKIDFSTYIIKRIKFIGNLHFYNPYKISQEYKQRSFSSHQILSDKMTTRKSMANTLLDCTMQSPPASSSPLRRKSVIPQKAISSALSENDDEAERLARRRVITDSSVPISPANLSDKRRSLGLGFLVHMPASQMAERITQCIKLGTENKINLKNAFSLEMIDFMTYMIKKKDVNMSNLQVASTSLDVSTKIYGFRVDGVHMDILKMIGGLDKQDKDNENKNNVEGMDCQEGIEHSQDKQKEKKKKRRSKQQIFTTAEALKINVETNKPSLITMEADLQTTDMLYQVMLPNHANSKFYPHPYNDILVDTVNSETIQDKDAVCDISKIDDFSNMEICPPLFYFDFHTWNADDEPDEVLPEPNNESGFQFDLDSSLPHEDEHVSTTMNYFNVEETEEEDVDRCAIIPNQVENIVDFRKVLTSTVPSKVSEYSFIQKSLNIHWAGPSHWKVTNLRKALSNSGVENQVHRHAQGRRKKEIELCYNDETIERMNIKFLPSQTTKLHIKTAKMEWNEEMLTLPPDKHYDIIQATKLFLHTTTLKRPEQHNDNDTDSLFDDVSNNYTGENDMSDHCTIEENEYQGNKENEAIDNCIRPEDDAFGSQMPFTGSNLVAVPKLTNKVNIAYSVRAKKIDMRQLKQSIWKCLRNKKRESSQEEGTQEAVHQDTDNKMVDKRHFSDIYKTLPRMLSKTNVEALSLPISFVSLLHLANEKTLKINSSSDMADLVIEQG